MRADYAITFACYNQREFTERFIASLDREAVDFSRIIAVDNGSTDGTREWLGTLGLGGVILNRHNLGCGAAWNQGAMALQAEWTIVMNNDVICGEGWLHGLIEGARRHQLSIASPGLIEGELDYDFPAFEADARHRLDGYCRQGRANAVCMAIHHEVWAQIGYFLPVPRLLGYEDTIFFRQVEQARIACGMVGSAWLHHFGMTTQKAVKLERQMAERDSLGNRALFRHYMNQSWLERKWLKHRSQAQTRNSMRQEFERFRMTVHGLRINGDFEWH